MPSSIKNTIIKSNVHKCLCRLIRKVGHKLKEIGALSHPLRAEKNREVIEGAHMLTRVEEYLEQCFIAMEHFTGKYTHKA